MSETKKKSIHRKERGLNVRVVQEQKDNKSGHVRVNTRQKKNTSKKKTAKKADTLVTKKTNKEIKSTEKPAVKKVSKKAEKIQKSVQKKSATKKEDPYKDLVWKKVEVTKKPLGKKTELKSESTQAVDSAFGEFETLKLHTENERAKSKIVLRDVAQDKPGENSYITHRLSKGTSNTSAQTVKLTKENVTMSAVPKPVEKISAREIKEREIKKAINAATKLPQTPNKRNRKSKLTGNFGVVRTVLAIGCLSLAVFAIVLLATAGSGPLSNSLGALGIDVSYPSHAPRGYNLVDVTSASGQVIMKFKSDEGGYTITKEQTDWNSAGLLANFVKPTYGDDYTMIEEQGLTLYMGDRWGAWVNGGVFYSLTIDSGNLTKKQIKAIATSQ